MATKKTGTGKGGKQSAREPGFFSDYGGYGIKMDKPSKPAKKPSGKKK